jgi:hypothetical protein
VKLQLVLHKWHLVLLVMRWAQLLMQIQKLLLKLPLQWPQLILPLLLVPLLE